MLGVAEAPPPLLLVPNDRHHLHVRGIYRLSARRKKSLLDNPANDLKKTKKMLNLQAMTLDLQVSVMVAAVKPLLSVEESRRESWKASWVVVAMEEAWTT